MCLLYIGSFFDMMSGTNPRKAMETNSEPANCAVVKCWYRPTEPLPGIVGGTRKGAWVRTVSA